MEDAVCHDLHAQIPQGAGLVCRQQMVPLQDLVQQDAIKEAAHAKAQQVTAPGGAAPRGGVMALGWPFHGSRGPDRVGSTAGVSSAGLDTPSSAAGSGLGLPSYSPDLRRSGGASSLRWSRLLASLIPCCTRCAISVWLSVDGSTPWSLSAASGRSGGRVGLMRGSSCKGTRKFIFGQTRRHSRPPGNAARPFVLRWLRGPGNPAAIAG